MFLLGFIVHDIASVAQVNIEEANDIENIRYIEHDVITEAVVVHDHAGEVGGLYQSLQGKFTEVKLLLSWK